MHGRGKRGYPHMVNSQKVENSLFEYIHTWLSGFINWGYSNQLKNVYC